MTDQVQKTAVVAGASGGVGCAVAPCLAQDGSLSSGTIPTMPF
jgi:NADP-dependent 3-hydroxy acid dehydrogenase YdfG